MANLTSNSLRNINAELRAYQGHERIESGTFEDPGSKA